jgi:hypothetical protein
MDELTEKYRKLNPFVQNSVGENVIWASGENDFCDVESINESAFKALLSGIESVKDDGKTRALFLVGPAGSGKSHLFARLRRKLPSGQFTFVSNPPTSAPHIKRFILKKVVAGMTRPVMGTDGPLPYSQLRRMVYSLLQKLLKPKGLSPEKIHGFWKTISRAKYPKIQSHFIQALANVPPLGIPAHVGHVLFQILDDEKRDLAGSWLSGIQNLSEDELKCLGIPAPLADDEISEMMKHLGHLSFGAGPIVLLIDQLDGLAREDQILEIESLMIDLNDASRNWYVIISLIEERFNLWISTLSEPFKGKFGAVTGASVGLVTAELSGLSEEQRRQLIMARLGTSGLISQRTSDGIVDPCYPLSKAAIQELTCSDISNPRMLIQKALQTYVSAVSGSGQVRKPTLLDFVEQRFADLRVELREEDLAVDTASVADRIEELFAILWFVRVNSPLTGTDGSLYKDLPNFEGADRVLTCGETQVRLVCYDVQQKNKFPSVLNKILKAPPTTILVRDGRVRISGRATAEKLDLFQKDKRFFHLSLDQIKNLHTLGSLLAKMREGEFDNEETEPRPTERGVYECLAQHSDLVETDLAQAFLGMAGLAGESEGKPATGDDETATGGPDSLKPNDPIVVGLARIMEEERWMSFERLCVRVSSRGISADPQKVYKRLKARPLCDSVLIYPRHVNLLESIGIVIWSLEE